MMQEIIVGGAKVGKERANRQEADCRPFADYRLSKVVTQITDVKRIDGSVLVIQSVTAMVGLSLSHAAGHLRPGGKRPPIMGTPSYFG